MKKMLLRSSSSPILNSWLPNPTSGSSPESNTLTRTRSVCFVTSLHCEDIPGRCTPTRSSVESDLKDPLKPKKSLMLPKVTEGKEPQNMVSILLSSSGLGESMATEGCYAVAERERMPLMPLVGGGGGGKSYGGGGGSYDGSGSQDSGSWNGHDNTDAYYEMMIKANPGNALLLANYAKFLKEVKGDFTKAEEYCERSILANSNDANVLSLYADLIWQTQNDAERAEAYFDQAVKTDPNDCSVLASYARFLWDVDDDEEEEELKSEYGLGITSTSFKFFEEGSHWPPLATASQSNLCHDIE